MNTPNDPNREELDRLIKAFGGLRPMARRLNIPLGTVQGWQTRGNIPSARIDSVRDLARQHGVEFSQSETANKARRASLSLSALRGRGQKKRETKDTPDFSQKTDASSETRAKKIRFHSGHWALALAVCALGAIVLRPLWAEPIDTRILGTQQNTDPAGLALRIETLENSLEETLKANEEIRAELALLAEREANTASGNSDVSAQLNALSAQLRRDIRQERARLALEQRNAAQERRNIEAQYRALEDRLQIVLIPESTQARQAAFQSLFALEALRADLEYGRDFQTSLGVLEQIAATWAEDWPGHQSIDALRPLAGGGLASDAELRLLFENGVGRARARYEAQRAQNWQDSVLAFARNLVQWRNVRAPVSDNPFEQAAKNVRENRHDLALSMLAPTGIAEVDNPLYPWFEAQRARQQAEKHLQALRRSFFEFERRDAP